MNRDNLTIPNALTASRFITTGLAIWSGLDGDWSWALLWAIIAVLSDFFDGKLARYLKCESHLGAEMDPWADKAFLTTILMFDYYTVFIVIVLELVGKCFSSSVRKKSSEHVIAHGSRTITALQMLTIILLIVSKIYKHDFAGREIFGWLIALSTIRLAIYVSLWKSYVKLKKGNSL